MKKRPFPVYLGMYRGEKEIKLCQSWNYRKEGGVGETRLIYKRCSSLDVKERSFRRAPFVVRHRNLKRLAVFNSAVMLQGRDNVRHTDLSLPSSLFCSHFCFSSLRGIETVAICTFNTVINSLTPFFHLTGVNYSACMPLGIS